VRLPIPRGRRAILALGVPLGLAAAGALVFTQMSAGSSVPAKVPDPGAGQIGPILALESRVVNLTGVATGGYKYAKVGVSIELRPEAASFYDLHGEARTKAETTELDKYTETIPVLLDSVGTVVSAHDSATLTSATGREKLKTELLAAFKAILGDETVLKVLFTDFVMQ
jgi:flagellar basal body-associated protein FliL